MLIAPWLNVFRPATAAHTLASGSTFAFCTVFLINTLIFAAVIVGLVIWDATNLVVVLDPVAGPQTRSAVEVWRDYHPGGQAGQLEVIAVFMMMATLPLVAFGAWLFLPLVHQGERAVLSLWRSAQAVVAGSGALILLVGSARGLVNMVHSIRPGSPAAVWVDLLAGFGAGGTTGAIVLLVIWLNRTAVGVRPPATDEALSPLCEGCGYDLTHVPSNRRCPECSLDVNQSLVAGVRRRESGWERRGTWEDWFATSWAVLASPTRFYSTLRLREDDHAICPFANRHYCLMGVGAGVWAMPLFYVDDPTSTGLEILAMSSWFFLLAPLAGWGIQHLAASVVATLWFAGGRLREPGWLRRVVAFETPYLWLFCLHNGLLITSFVMFDNWMSGLAVGRLFQQIALIPAEPAALVHR